MDRPSFALLLKSALLDAWANFVQSRPADCPYAYALIAGPLGNYLGYAIATEEGLCKIAAEYERNGYRYRSHEWEEFDNRERLSIWLRWANPDDGWQYGEFGEQFPIQEALDDCGRAETFGDCAEDLEDFCTQVLESLQREPAWQPWRARVIVGFTYGEDPRDFLRSATRANSYRLVKRLWQECWHAEELSHRIGPPER